MGYKTEFYGRFDLNRKLTAEHAAYLSRFGTTRRMKRDEAKAEILADPLRIAVGLPIGKEGGYYVGPPEDKTYGQTRGPSIIDYDESPAGQPGLWCKWVPTADDFGIEWNGVEKFYDYTRWLEYIIFHFLAPWGYVLNGKVEWVGSNYKDLGVIHVKDNRVHGDSR